MSAPTETDPLEHYLGLIDKAWVKATREALQMAPGEHADEALRWFRAGNLKNAGLELLRAFPSGSHEVYRAAAKELIASFPFAVTSPYFTTYQYHG